MKTLLSTFLLFSIFSNCYSQQRASYIMWPYGSKDKIEFTETVYPPAANADSLFNLAKSFIISKFNSERDSIMTIDNKRTIVCKGSILLPIPELGERGKGYIRFTLTISCYYRGYRYTITNLEHLAQNPDGVSGGALENDKAACGGALLPMRYWNNEKSKAYYYIQSTIESLKESMTKRSDG